MELDFPIGSRVRIGGKEVSRSFIGKMATIVSAAEIKANNRGPVTEAHPYGLRCDEICDRYRYWVSRPEHFEFVEGPGPHARFLLDKNELLKHIRMIERGVRFKNKKAKQDAEHALKMLTVMFRLQDGPRGAAKTGA